MTADAKELLPQVRTLIAEMRRFASPRRGLDVAYELADTVDGWADRIEDVADALADHGEATTNARASSTPDAPEAPTSAPQGVDLRPWVQHKSYCGKLVCQARCCGHYERAHVGDYLHQHPFRGGDCNCGLDAVLALLPGEGR
jgi:hypothetical protein